MEQIGTKLTDTPEDYWADKILVNCHFSDIQELSKGSSWVVDHVEFNTDTQEGDVVLRPVTIDDL